MLIFILKSINHFIFRSLAGWCVMKIYWNGKSKNIIGGKIKQLRTEKGVTQKGLAAKLQLEGFEFNDLTILRIENGTRFVSDIEVKALAYVLCTSYEYLLE